MRAGVALLTEKGFSAVGLEEILSSVGMPKGSVYYYFESKTAFGLTLVDAYATEEDAWDIYGDHRILWPVQSPCERDEHASKR